jgi:hypothetical protein
MRPYLRPAPHSGRCKKCGHRLGKGEHVYYAKHWGMACEQCGGSDTATPAPRKTKRGKTPAPAGGAMTGEKPARKCADGVWRYEFASVGEAVRDALDDFAQNDTSREWLRNRMTLALSGKDDWANYFTQDRFLRELSNPSKPLLDAVDRMREQLIGAVAAPVAQRRKVRRGQEWGEELDVDRYLARDPSPWDRSVREKQPRRTVTIGCNLSVNAGTKPEELLYRGAAALALADVLTSRGVNVGIVAFDSVLSPTDLVRNGVIRYTLKDPLMPLDLGAITFALCEIAFFRVVGAVGGSRHWPGKLCHSLGSAVNPPAADRAGIDYLVDADVLGEEQATQWLKGCLANTESEVCHV